MWKLIIGLISMTSALNSPAFGHPLEGAARNLSAAASALELQSKQYKDADLTQEAARLQRQIGKLWTEVMLAPLRTNERRMERLGYRLSMESAVSGRFHVYRNANSTLLAQDLQDLKPARWSELSSLVGEQTATILDLNNLIDSNSLVEGITETDREQVTIHLARQEALKILGSLVNNTVACMNDFNASFAKSGLLPERNGTTYTWSSPDFQRVYGVNNIADVSASQKRVLRREISNLLQKSSLYDSECISIPVAAFFENELRNLGKE